MAQRTRYIITGRVQGVGFRPSIYRLACSIKLTGFVKNATNGVIIEVQGPPTKLDQFDRQLPNHYPPMAQVYNLTKASITVKDSQEFIISKSERSGELLIGMPPDIALCQDCLNELIDPNNRRHDYPFINCTNCGPRFSIINTLPYDRPYTSMSEFNQCPACQTEYDNPMDRRFDAQPNACPACGPSLQLLNQDHQLIDTRSPLADSITALAKGQIVAIKGIGGFHLCCDGNHDEAIAKLRTRKHRQHKALAVMFKSIEEIKKYCHVSKQEEYWLSSPSAPIVILNQHQPSLLTSSISPDTKTVGAFLPYTPLHHLLLAQLSPLIMTSANKSDEPIAINEQQLDGLLGPIADLALIHNRDILRRVDDSVMTVVNDQPLLFRRSRGFVPNPIELPFSGPDLLACGSDLKNTFGLTKKNQLYLSQHIGDLKDYQANLFYHEQIKDLNNLLKVTPELIVHDLHPNYLSTNYATNQAPIDHLAVQHHHAHIAACMTEHHLQAPVIGLAMDGTGYGDDGRLWGGELFICDLKHYDRKFHFDYIPMPGQQQAIMQPSRMALAYLKTYMADDEANHLAQKWLPGLDNHDLNLLGTIIDKQLQSPLTSSAGRLFDAVSALLGFHGQITYEGQAAICLERLADPSITADYPVEIKSSVICFRPMFNRLLDDLANNCSPSTIAAKFHNTLANVLTTGCVQLREVTTLNQVVLSGGVFQNIFLLTRCINSLNKHGFQVYSHHIVPPNDSGLAVGQAAIALAKTVNIKSILKA